MKGFLPAKIVFFPATCNTIASVGSRYKLVVFCSLFLRSLTKYYTCCFCCQLICVALVMLRVVIMGNIK